MRKVGAYVVAGALAATVSLPTPGLAFGLNIGPFHLGLPFFGRPFHFGHRHRTETRSDHNRVAILDKADVDEAGNAGAGQDANPALLYPKLGLSGLYEQIFEPRNSAAWPFGYDAMVRTAFVKRLPAQDAQICQQPDQPKAVIGRITAEVKPNAQQMPLLQKLGQALGTASGYLTRSCPPQLPAQPVARLQLMQSQIQALTMALDVVRPPLQQFEQSLTPNQRMRFGAIAPGSADASGCGAAPAATDWSIKEIDHAVQPDDAQRGALSDLGNAFAAAAADLHAHCPKTLGPTPLERLEAIEARLDASWRAALAMQVAVGNFEGRLTDQQRGRFEAIDLAAR